MMEEYRSNSNKSKEKQNEPIPEKKVEKIISGSVRSKKKSGIKKLIGVFAPEDVDDVKNYIFEVIVVPGVKDIILDAVKTVLGVNGRSERKGMPSSKIAYRKYYDDRSDSTRCSGGSRNRNTYDYDDIIFSNRGEAEEVLCQMKELIVTYKIVRVSDFYDLVGVTSNWTADDYGWSDVSGATIVRTIRGEYMIRLPRPLPIDD